MTNNILHINSDEEFQIKVAQHIHNNETTKLSVLYFTASWCAPCRSISPTFEKLALNNLSSNFFKIDVEKCPNSAGAYGVRSVPTFLFYTGAVKVFELNNSRKELLESKVNELASSSGDLKLEGSSDLMPNTVDLIQMLDKSKCECLNASDHHTLDHAFNKDFGLLASDTDAQLIIFLTFNQFVKIQALQIVAPHDKGPKNIKLFVNYTTPPDFDACEKIEGTQEFTLAPNQMDGKSVIPLKYVKFQKVSTICLFIENNQCNGDVTQIERLSILGAPISTTNMSDFKRVAGKAGEAHG